MINVLLDILNWFINTIDFSIAFPVIDFQEIYATLKTVLYYPVKVLGLFNITLFFTLWNLDWVLTVTLGVAKTLLRFIRGMK